MNLPYLLSGLLAVTALAAAAGAVLFAAVLGARAHDAHQRGLARVRNHNRRTTA